MAKARNSVLTELRAFVFEAYDQVGTVMSVRTTMTTAAAARMRFRCRRRLHASVRDFSSSPGVLSRPAVALAAASFWASRSATHAQSAWTSSYSASAWR